MRFRFIPLCLCALATLFFAAGCGRYESSPFTAEIDEPGYRRGKELLRQARNQEALASFLKVVEKRGDDAPESHLELGILYQQHIKDPIAAIYHYRKFRELKRNSPQSDLVRQRIDAATREFARTLPGQPLDNQIDRLDLLEKMDQLQRENLQLKEQLISVRTHAASPPRPPTNTPAPPAPPPASHSLDSSEPEQLAPLAINTTESPITAAPEPEPEVPSVPTPPVATNSRPMAPTPPPASPPATPTSYRRHVVAKGDTLFSLAQRYYGNRSRWRDIYAANRHVLPNESALSIGMELRIPQ
jgi:tetratricopeptide (TPR) repeat protein